MSSRGGASCSMHLSINASRGNFALGGFLQVNPAQWCGSHVPRYPRCNTSSSTQHRSNYPCKRRHRGDLSVVSQKERDWEQRKAK